STWTGTGTCAGTGGPRPGRRRLPGVPGAEDGPRAMGDAPWELVSRDCGDGTFLVPKWFSEIYTRVLGDSLCNLFSSTKCIEYLLLTLCHD
ncbi:hypothetical protein E2I00_017628, partial [Balaenoptera physalus]